MAGMAGIMGAMGITCSNTCNYARDGECDDGGPGAEFSSCSVGSDCVDCGPREVVSPPYNGYGPVPPPSTYGPVPPPYEDPLAASFGRRLTTSSSGISDAASEGPLAITIGTYDATNPGQYGATFQFFARDRDGQPIVSDSFLGQKRAFVPQVIAPTFSSGRELISRGWASVTVDYIGDKRWNSQSHTYDLVLPTEMHDRARDGLYEVTVSLSRTGVQTVQLYGPKDSYDSETDWFNTFAGSVSGLVPFPWNVTYNGTCPAGQVPSSGVGVSATSGYGGDECGCDRGSSSTTSADETSNACVACLVDTVKPYVSSRIAGDLCRACSWMTDDTNRQLTRGTGTTSWSECGCLAGFYMSAQPENSTSSSLQQRCPDAADPDAWHAIFASDYTRLEPQATECGCSAGGCPDTKHLQCVEQRCRKQAFDQLTQWRGHLPSEYASVYPWQKSVITHQMEPCLACNVTQACPAFTALESIKPVAGYWRKTNFSSKVYHCLGSGSKCNGTNGIAEFEYAIDEDFNRKLVERMDGSQLGHCNISTSDTNATRNLTTAEFFRCFNSQYASPWCSLGHEGPLCEVCQAQWYANNVGQCLPCGGSSGEFFTYVLPFTLVFAAIAILVTCFISFCLYKACYPERVRHHLPPPCSAILCFFPARTRQLAYSLASCRRSCTVLDSQRSSVRSSSSLPE